MGGSARLVRRYATASAQGMLSRNTSARPRRSGAGRAAPRPRHATATAWLLSAGAAVVLCATMLVAASLQAWHRDRVQYRPLARTCAAVAVACLGLGAARPAPLVLGLALVVLLSIPWVLAVAHRLANAGDSATD